MFLLLKQNAEQIHNMTICNKTLEVLETLKNKFLKNKQKLNIRNACLHSIQNLLYSRLLFVDIKFKLHSSQISTFYFMSVKFVLSPYGTNMECSCLRISVLILCISQWYEDKAVRRSNEDLHNVYSLPDIFSISVVELKKMRWEQIVYVTSRQMENVHINWRDWVGCSYNAGDIGWAKAVRRLWRLVLGILPRSFD